MCDRIHRSNIDPALVVGPGDDVAWLGATPAGDDVYAVVHRRHGLFTHVYRIGRCPRRNRPLVHLERVICGARLREARVFAAARLGAYYIQPALAAAE